MLKTSQNPFWRTEKTNEKLEKITITLWPYRSLGERGYLYLMIAFISLVFILSVLFYSLGAWPVIGFLGLEIGLVWLVFRLNYNSGRNFEQIFITPEKTSIEKVNWRGARRCFTIVSPWIVANCIKTDGNSDKLILSYHAEKLEIGSFLPPQEKLSLANALNDSFNRMRGVSYTSTSSIVK